MHTVRVPGRGANVVYDHIWINGKEAGYADGTPSVTMVYGGGVILQLTEKGRGVYWVRSIAIQGSPVVVIRYHFTR